MIEEWVEIMTKYLVSRWPGYRRTAGILKTVTHLVRGKCYVILGISNTGTKKAQVLHHDHPQQGSLLLLEATSIVQLLL